MKKAKELSPEELAEIEHVVQTQGEIDPAGTRLADGRTVEQAQADAQRVNDEWEAARLARRADQARESVNNSVNNPVNQEVNNNQSGDADSGKAKN